MNMEKFSLQSVPWITEIFLVYTEGITDYGTTSERQKSRIPPRFLENMKGSLITPV